MGCRAAYKVSYYNRIPRCVLQIAFVVLPGTLNEGNADRAAFAVPIVLGVLSGMYIVALKLLVIMIRRSTFRLKWQPKFREFMVQRTPHLEKVYSSADRATPRISRP